MPELVVVCHPDVEVYQGSDEEEAVDWAICNALMSEQVINLDDDESVHAVTLACTDRAVYWDGRIRRDVRINRDRLIKELLLPPKIPAESSGTYYGVPVYSEPDYDAACKEPWAYVTIVLRPGSGRGHRLYVKCGCGELVTAGKYNQHAKACGSALPVGILAVREQIARYRAAGRTWQECQRFHPEPWIVIDVIGQLGEAEKNRLRHGEVTFEQLCMKAH